MDIEKLKEKLKQYKKEDIIITNHAEIQAYVREVDLEEVKENIVNPEKLVYAKEQKTEKPEEKKYDCYFAYSKQLCHRYILTINRKVIIVTIIKINREWQKIIERK
jgi:hypothetical protein